MLWDIPTDLTVATQYYLYIVDFDGDLEGYSGFFQIEVALARARARRSSRPTCVCACGTSQSYLEAWRSGGTRAAESRDLTEQRAENREQTADRRESRTNHDEFVRAGLARGRRRQGRPPRWRP